jgi:uncharacterized protein (DUF433 family)
VVDDRLPGLVSTVEASRAVAGAVVSWQDVCGGGVAMDLDRITVEPDKLEGRPCVRGLRMTVETIVRLVAAGWSFDQILEDYPDLEREDITQALEYAAAATNVHFYRLKEPA